MSKKSVIIVTIATDNAFANQLLAWFHLHGRKSLPWQQKPTLYRIWISEIMLQQTQVTTVIPYFNRFMARFANPCAVANATLDEVLHHWSGLGYYARARNLHQAAVIIRDQHQGEFPACFDQVLALPGIGRSTAGAILSLAQGQHYPILDGNVKRVLARCFMVAGWPGQSCVQKQLWTLAERLMPETAVDSYNQALMDLGSMVCTRSTPACHECPLNSLCGANKQGAPNHYPAPKPSKVLPVKQISMLLINNEQGELILERRPPSGIWGGLWSLPECTPQQDPADWCYKQLGAQSEVLEQWDKRRHSFTHFHLEILPIRVALGNSANCVMDGDRHIWYNITVQSGRGLAAPVTRLIDQYRKCRGEKR